MSLSLNALTGEKAKSLLLVFLLSALPLVALANRQLDATSSFTDSVTSGLAHPFMGLNYLIIALGTGMLMSQVGRFKQGLIALVFGFSMGFLLSVNFVVSRVLVESGILLSIVLLAMALFSRYFNNTCEINLKPTTAFKSLHNTALIIFGILAVCHGAAHGMDLPAKNIASGFYIGMLTSILALYISGKGIAYLLNRYSKNSFVLQRILACIGLCSLLYI